jgi:hypothetical protein
MSEGGISRAIEEHKNEKLDPVREQCRKAFNGICEGVREIASKIPGANPELVDGFKAKASPIIERFLSNKYKTQQEAFDEATETLIKIREPFDVVKEGFAQARSKSKAVEVIKGEGTVWSAKPEHRAEAHMQAGWMDAVEGVPLTIREEVLDPYAEMFK